MRLLCLLALASCAVPQIPSASSAPPKDPPLRVTHSESLNVFADFTQALQRATTNTCQTPGESLWSTQAKQHALWLCVPERLMPGQQLQARVSLAEPHAIIPAYHYVGAINATIKLSEDEAMLLFDTEVTLDYRTQFVSLLDGEEASRAAAFRVEGSLRLDADKI